MQNKKFKSIQVYLGLVVVLAFVIANIASAANTGTVTATVTLQNISVTVASGTVAYGTLAASATKTTLSGGLNDTQTATNNGNVAEDFALAGSNTTNWTLSGTSSPDHYVHKYCTATCGTDASPGAGFTALSTGNTTITSGGGVAALGTQTFDLEIIMPSSSTFFTQQSPNITIVATAH